MFCTKKCNKLCRTVAEICKHFLKCKAITSFLTLQLILVELVEGWVIISEDSRGSSMALAGRHIRSPLARTVYNRMMEDAEEQDRDHSVVIVMLMKYPVITL